MYTDKVGNRHERERVVVEGRFKFKEKSSESRIFYQYTSSPLLEYLHTSVVKLLFVLLTTLIRISDTKVPSFVSFPFFSSLI